MKTRVIWLLAAMGLLAVSCMVKEREQDAMMTDAPRITAMVAAESPATKVSVTESDGEARSTVWDKGDEIAVFIHNAKALEYALEGDGGASSGVFSYVSGFGGAIQFPEVYGVYPYAKDVAFTGSTLQVNFPAAQAYTEDSFDPKANLMVAASRTNDLYFRNVGGYLVLKLWGEGVSVKKIVIEGVAGEPLAGPAAVWASESEAPEIEIAEETAEKAITLTCETPVALGATEDAGTEFWIVVPPTCFEEGLKVTVFGEDGSVFTRTAKGDDTEDGSLNIARKEVYRLGTEVALEDANGHDYVEMAPGFKVATCNVGAETPEERGDVFKWGETEPASSLNFDWDSYKWYVLDENYYEEYLYYYVYNYGYLSKYSYGHYFTEDNWSTSEWLEGDGLIRLEPEDDAATVNWGGDWLMPTANQLDYLTNENLFTWTKAIREDAEGNDVEGYEVVSQVPGFEGNTVFLPCILYSSGNSYCHYWASDICGDYHCLTAYALDDEYLSSPGLYNSLFRTNTLLVRPVLPVPATSLSLEETELSLDLALNPSMRLTVSLEPEYTSDLVVWSSADESVALVDANGKVTAVAAGETTITATAGSFTKTCAVVVTALKELYFEDFEDDFEDRAQDWIFQDRDDDEYYWFYTTGNSAYSGSGYLSSQSYKGGTSLDPDNWAFTPEITLSSTSNTLSYWIASYSSTYRDHYAVYVTADDPFGPTEPEYELLIEENVGEAVSSRAGVYYHVVLPIPSKFNGKTVRIVFRHFDSYDMYQFYVDDIGVYASND